MRAKRLTLDVRLFYAKTKRKIDKIYIQPYTGTLDKNGRVKNTNYSVIQIKGLGYHGLDWEMGIKRQKERSR